MATDWGAIIGGAAQIAGQIAANRAKGRADEQALATNQNQVANQQYGTQQNAKVQAYKALLDDLLGRGTLDLQRRKFSNDDISENLARAMAGDKIARQTDVSITHPRANVVHVQGGYRPSSRSPQLKAMGEDVVRQALIKQMTGGEQFDPLAEIDPSTAFVDAPEMVEGSKSNALDSILQWAAYGGAGAGLLANAMKPKQPVVPVAEENPFVLRGSQVPTFGGGTTFGGD